MSNHFVELDTKKINSKSDITKEIIRLRDYGYTVLTFQNNKMGRGGIKGMTDYFILGKGRIFFIEGKFGKDELSEVQINFQNEIYMVETATYKRIKYLIATENNVCQIVENILGGKI